MSRPSPTVSVITPVFNGAHLIAETLASLHAQHFDDFEAIIVDDCSTDGTPDIVRAMIEASGDTRFRLVRAAENGGPVKARNLAVAQACGRYIAALDADDLCLPERLARQVAYLEAHADVVLVGTAAEVLDQGSVRASRLPSITTPALIEWMLQIGNPLVWSSVMMRADAARALSPFTRPERVYAEDFDLYHRLMPLGRIARIDEPLLLYRHHGGGISKRFAERMHDAACAVLADAHRAIFGEAAEERCALIVRHVMNRRPVPDRATLAALGATLTAIQQAFFADRAPDRDDRRLIRWQTARLWGDIGRASIRAGAIGIADAVAVRPDHLGMGYNRFDDLAVAQAIGGLRTMLRRNG
ncbi:MAG: glycosyltransferase family 2 protein [Sphingomonas sp.]